MYTEAIASGSTELMDKYRNERMKYYHCLKH